MSEPKLPDFDDLYDLSFTIANLQTKKLKLEIKLEVLLAEVTKKVTEDSQFWVNNRPPSMSYIGSHYHIIGYNNNSKKEIIEIKSKIAELDGSLTECKNKFLVMRDQIDVWRTFSANKRLSV